MKLRRLIDCLHKIDRQLGVDREIRNIACYKYGKDEIEITLHGIDDRGGIDRLYRPGENDIFTITGDDWP